MTYLGSLPPVEVIQYVTQANLHLRQIIQYLPKHQKLYDEINFKMKNFIRKYPIIEKKLK